MFMKPFTILNLSGKIAEVYDIRRKTLKKYKKENKTRSCLPKLDWIFNNNDSFKWFIEARIARELSYWRIGYRGNKLP